MCYQIADWLLLSREITKMESDGVDESYAFARFKQGQANYGYLLYSAITKDGTVVRPPAMAGSLESRLDSLFAPPNPDSELMILQLFVTIDGRIDPSSLGKLKSDFLEMRSRLQQQANSL